MLAWINKFNAGIGKSAACLALAMVVLEFVVVLLRYAFEWGSIALQEGVIYLHASLFMATAAWVLQTDGHVRVDIFYREMAARNKARVNLGGALFLLLPTSLFLLYISWDYVALSWKIREGSKETGGLDAVFLLKSLMPLSAAMLALQALAQAGQAWLDLRGDQHA
jgi:TRAP-type mannitol/chloroaromatic compound transport system permease small subunit